jgi:glycosyltransferase involved in cell wall biosynthesis
MRALREKGFEVYAVAPYDEFSENLKKEFKYYEIKNLDRKGINPFKDLKLLKEYIDIYRKIKPDLVINFTIKPNIYSSIACGMLKIKSISVITGLGYVFVKGGVLEKIVRTLYKTAFKFNEYVMFLNQDDLDILVKKKIINSQKGILLKGEGINTTYFSPDFCKSIEKEKNKFIFLLVARLLWDKGIGEFLEAGKKLKEKYPYTELWLLGALDRGNPSAIPEDKIIEWERENIIKYLGETNDVRPYICQSDCVVLPSYYREGVPRSLLEAMAMEKPIITTDAPGCRDVIIDNVNGFMIKAKDSISLYNAIEKMINLDTEERLKMGQEGRKLVLKEFDEKIIIGKYLKLIEEILRQ